jgi:hypothetical protein
MVYTPAATPPKTTAPLIFGTLSSFSIFLVSLGQNSKTFWANGEYANTQNIMNIENIKIMNPMTLLQSIIFIKRISFFIINMDYYRSFCLDVINKRFANSVATGWKGNPIPQCNARGKIIQTIIGGNDMRITEIIGGDEGVISII